MAKNDFNIDELVKSQDHLKDMSALQEKLGKCYSEDRYREFEGTVEGIAIKTLQLDEPRKKIKEYATEAAKEYFQSSTWNQIKFWVPTVISILALGFTGYLAFFKH